MSREMENLQNKVNNYEFKEEFIEITNTEEDKLPWKHVLRQVSSKNYGTVTLFHVYLIHRDECYLWLLKDNIREPSSVNSSSKYFSSQKDNVFSVHQSTALCITQI